jgi:hypothetical protein
LKAIAGYVKDWAGNWDAVWDNILLGQSKRDFGKNIHRLEPFRYA